MNKWRVFKMMMKVGMLLCILFAVFQSGIMYIDYKADHPKGNFISFLSHKEVETYNTFQGAPSEKFLRKAALYNKVVRTMWFALFFFVMFEVFDWKENPDQHWVNILKKKIKEMGIDNET